MNTSRIAIIDMGTNTFHLLIADVNDNGFVTIHRERVAVRIGKGGISHGLITPDALERALKTLVDFKVLVDEFLVTQVYATATSAIRNAKNGKALADKIEKATGIAIRIISGEEEAQFIYYGVKNALKLGQEPSVIMDIGGGSVEFIIGNQEEIFWKYSFEIGAQRLLDRFHQHDPIERAEIDALEAFLSEQLSPLFEACNTYQPKSLIGSSGTFDTLLEIYKLDTGRETPILDETLPIPAFMAIYDDIISKNKLERLQIEGMLEMRVEMIVVACCLIHVVLAAIPLERLRISSYALKEGVLYSIIHELQEDIRKQ